MGQSKNSLIFILTGLGLGAILASAVRSWWAGFLYRAELKRRLQQETWYE